MQYLSNSRRELSNSRYHNYMVICDSANGSNRGTHDVNHIIFPEKQIKTFFISHN